MADEVVAWDPNAEGYPLELVEGEPSDVLVCMFCNGLVYHALITECCGKLYCGCCLRTWLKARKTCPQRCEGDVQTVPVESNKPMWALLGKTSVKCTTQCGWKGDYSGLDEHLGRDCQQAHVQCMHCAQLHIRADAAKHGPGLCDLIDAPPEGFADKDQENAWLREQLVQSRKDGIEKGQEIESLKCQLRSVYRTFDAKLREMEQIRAMQRRIAESLHPPPNPAARHPGSWQRTKWRGTEVTHWSCCRANNHDAPGCFVDEVPSRVAPRARFKFKRMSLKRRNTK